MAADESLKVPQAEGAWFVMVAGEALGTTGGEASIRAESICGVTTGLGGISAGLTVRVAIVACRGSLAQSFQLFATRR